jgi:DNA-binding transcriptional LysR family regulator
MIWRDEVRGQGGSDQIAARSAIGWRQLEYFRVAARLEHISKAAQELCLSQSGLSRALNTLEMELGAPLFERAGRSIRLTRYGQLFKQRVDRGMAEIDEGRAELADLLHPDRGAISLGYLSSLGASYVPRLIKDYRNLRPNVRFSLFEANGEELKSALKKGELDLAILASSTDSNFEICTLGQQDIPLIVPSDHILAVETKIPLRALAKEKFVSHKKGHFLRSTTEELCERAGFTANIAVEVDAATSIFGFVAAGFGIAFVPPDHGVHPGIATLKVVGPRARRTISVFAQRGRYLSASAKSFRSFAQSVKLAM